MKKMLVIAISALFVSFQAAAGPCDINTAHSLAKEAKQEFLDRYEGSKNWDDVKIAACDLGWAESVLGERRPNVSFALECGVVFEFSSQRKADRFADRIYAQRLSHLTFYGLFADETVPVCAEVN